MYVCMYVYLIKFVTFFFRLSFSFCCYGVFLVNKDFRYTVAMVTAALRCDDEWKSSCNGRHVTPVRPMTSYVTSPGVSGRHGRTSVDNCVQRHASIGDYVTPLCSPATKAVTMGCLGCLNIPEISGKNLASISNGSKTVHWTNSVPRQCLFWQKLLSGDGFLMSTVLKTYLNQFRPRTH